MPVGKDGKMDKDDIPTHRQKVLNAIDASIAHWEKVERNKQRVVGGGECPLCVLCLDAAPYGDIGAEHCLKCPVFGYTGVYACKDTPYYEYTDFMDKHYTDSYVDCRCCDTTTEIYVPNTEYAITTKCELERRTLARDEIGFLKKVRSYYNERRDAA